MNSKATTPTTAAPLKAPFPWFGGKSRVAQLVWNHVGPVRNYCEPFFGSGAVLLGRPTPFAGSETVNDKDGFVANTWRAIARDPEGVAHHADNPVNENDLHARHSWLVPQREKLSARLEGDPDYYDAKIAGWWIWGLCCWIGSGWCSGKGPWQSVEMEDGNRQLVHLGDAGRGVNRKRVHLGNAGQGVNRKRVHLGDADDSLEMADQNGLVDWMLALAERLKRVRVCCGDWKRICTNTPTVKQGRTLVFLDPPYSAEADRNDTLYSEEDLSVAHDVRRWCLDNQNDPKLLIALCGYDGEHAMPKAWECVQWKAHGGYGSQAKVAGRGRANAGRERIWFSPSCAGKVKAAA